MNNIALHGAPGCGKTTKLIEYFNHLSRGQKVLLTTFRRDTADDIATRLPSNIQDDPKEFVNTIHGTCYRLLVAYGMQLMEPSDMANFNKETGYNLKFVTPDPDNPEKSTGIVDLLSWLENTGTPLSKMSKFPGFTSLNVSPKKAREVLQTYQKWKNENGKIDFIDMLTEVHKEGLVPQCDVLMVDEFQDLTPLQNKIIRMWSQQADTTIIAGDPLQAIYGFWGGSPSFFYQFDGQHDVLPHSYRLAPEIWGNAKNLAERYGMDVPEIETGNHKGNIKYLSERQYLNMVDRWEAPKGETCFHLVRANYQAFPIAHTLAEKGILWKGISGWTKSDIDLFNTILAVRKGATTGFLVEPLTKHFPEEYFYQKDNQFVPNSELLSSLRSSDPTSLMNRCGKIRAKRLTVALNCYNHSLQMDDIRTTLSTIHGSKGLEADRVFLHTKITKRIKDSMRKDWSAEARVYYVGLTRARNEVCIVYKLGTKNFRIPEAKVN